MRDDVKKVVIIEGQCVSDDELAEEIKQAGGIDAIERAIKSDAEDKE